MSSEFTKGWQSNNSYRHDKRIAESAGETARVCASGFFMWGAILIGWSLIMVGVDGWQNLYLPVILGTIIAGIFFFVVAWPLHKRSRRKNQAAMAAFHAKWDATLERIDE